MGDLRFTVLVLDDGDDRVFGNIGAAVLRHQLVDRLFVQHLVLLLLSKVQAKVGQDSFSDWLCCFTVCSVLLLEVDSTLESSKLYSIFVKS